MIAPVVPLKDIRRERSSHDLAFRPGMQGFPETDQLPTLASPAMELDHLCKMFGSHRAVFNLSLALRRGEILGLLGPNGSGKTTTLNMVCGLSRPTIGNVRILGVDIHAHPRRARQHLGVVPQETALYEELTAQRNLLFHADLYGVPEREKHRRIDRLLDLVSLSERRESRVRSFSGGMKRRLAIARALLHDPAVLLLDEPTLGVDVQNRAALWGHIRALRDEGRTILLTTNYLEEAQVLCDRLAIIDHGELLVVDTPDRLRHQFGGNTIVAEVATTEPLLLEPLRALSEVTEVTQEGQQITIQTSGTQTPFAEVTALLSQQSTITTIASQQASLDEVFLRLTGAALRD